MDLFFIIVFGSLIALVVFFLKRNTFKENDDGFSQANVSVNYSESTIRLGGKTFKVEKVKSVRWEANTGRRGNRSRAFIELEDFSKPNHRVSFITSGAAEKFVSRLCAIYSYSLCVFGVYYR